jgi:hypothetical protein
MKVHVFFPSILHVRPLRLSLLALSRSVLLVRALSPLSPRLPPPPLSEQEALDVLLNTKCIDTVFNRYYEADFSLKDITGKTALKLATVWECKRLIWKRYMGRALPLHPTP